MKKKMKRFLPFLLATCLSIPTFTASLYLSAIPLSASSIGTTSISNLKTNALENPMVVEDTNPEFSWQMNSDIIGASQKAYKLEVAKDKEFTDLVWDSGTELTNKSIGIIYDGSALTPETDYFWRVTVTDNDDQIHVSDVASFSTGLMNTAMSAWGGAKFIGSNELILDSASAYLFRVQSKFQINSGDNVSFIVGANDYRLKDSFQNVYGASGENFIRLEIDTTGVTDDASNTGGKFSVYRKGYHATDDINGDANVYPYKTVNLIDSTNAAVRNIFTKANKNSEHTIDIYANVSALTIQIDGITIAGFTNVGRPQNRPGADNNFNVSPYSTISADGVHTFYTTGDYPTYPHLASIGFQVKNIDDNVTITDYKLVDIGNSTKRTLFDSTTGSTYSIFDMNESGISAVNNKITINPINAAQLGPKYADPSYGSQSYVRTSFATEAGKEVEKARMLVTAMGSYEMFINGERMGVDWMNPGMSQFRETLTYHGYDVTNMIKDGNNAIGAIISQGFYTGYMTYTGANFSTFGDNEGLLAKLAITYTDGTTQTIITNPDTWKVYKDGPVRNGSHLQGERYDANKEAAIEGWKTNDYNDEAWKSAEIIVPKPGINFELIGRRDNPVRERERLTAKTVLNTHSADEKTWTYDMGVNMVGVPSITIPAGSLQANAVVIIRFGEVIYPGNSDSPNTMHPDGYTYESLYGNEGTYRKGAAGKILHESYRGAMSTDFYIAKPADATADVVIEPHFTFHGYRYIQITIPSRTTALPLENVKGIVLSSSELLTGTYKATTSDDNKTGTLANAFLRNVQRSQLGNFFSLPTDCPQRNERMGWTGDLQAYSRTATYNGDSQGFLRQWMVAVNDDQSIGNANTPAGGIGGTVPRYSLSEDTANDTSPTWGGAVCMVPWQLYQQYGDIQVVKENFNAMKLYLSSKLDARYSSAFYPGLSTQTGGLADHIALDGAAGASARMLNNAILIYFMEVTAIMSDAIGETEYAQTLRARRIAAIEDFNKAYIDPATGMTRNMNITNGNLENVSGSADQTGGNKNPNRGTSVIDSQSSYAAPLHYGVISDTMTITSGPNAGITYKEFATKRLAQLIADPSKSGNGTGTLPNGRYASRELPYTVTSGFAGTPTLLPALTKNGENETAYALFSSTNYASWFYPITLGATSIWELWNANELAFGKGGHSAMNSQNHYALGGSAQWLYEYQLGITSSGAMGYQNFVLQPLPGGNFTAIEGSYTSNYGVIKSQWTADGNGSASNGTVNKMLSYSATVPANTTATLYLPMSADMDGFKAVSGVTYIGTEVRNGVETLKFNLLSGGYDFTVVDGKLIVKISDDYQTKLALESVNNITPSSIIEGLAGNIQLEITGKEIAGATVELTLEKDGQIVATGEAIATADNFNAVFKLDSAPAAGDYKIVASINGNDKVSTDLSVMAYDNVWAMGYDKTAEGDLIISFNAPIASKYKSFDGFVIVDGIAQYNTETQGNTIIVKGLKVIDIIDGAEIKVSGVKFPTLFPSYSFTIVSSYTK